MAPLNQRLKEDQPVTFLPSKSGELKDTETLKAALISTRALALSCSGGHLRLDTDACNAQVGYVLLQKKMDDTTKPIGY